MKNCNNFPQLSIRATGQKNSKLPETNPHQNDSADQDSVAEITQWSRSRRYPRRRRSRAESLESLRRKALTRSRIERTNDTTDTSNIQTYTCEPIPTRPKADSASSCPTELSGPAGFLENENAVVATGEHIQEWTKERGSQYLMSQRTAFETKLRRYGTMPVPSRMREELERPTPCAKTLERLYKYYRREIPKPIPLLWDRNEFLRVRCKYSKTLRSELFEWWMKRLRKEIRKVWENKGDKEDGRDPRDSVRASSPARRTRKARGKRSAKKASDKSQKQTKGISEVWPDQKSMSGNRRSRTRGHKP